MKRGLHAAGWCALAVACVLLWPQRWGGSMTYDITHGTSMQPTFHTGDLAVLRTSGAYRVGDVAAYRSPSLHTTVMHRITTKTQEGFTFKGDNNSFTDPDTVRADAMLGKLLFRVPSVGRYLTWFVNPLHLAIAVAGLFLLLGDRKERVQAQPAPSAPAAATRGPLVVKVTAFRLPHEMPTADVEDGEDLHQLASLHGLAVLRDATTDYVLQGGVLFQHVRAVIEDEGHRKPSQHGRDWQYTNVVELAERRSA